MLKLKEIIKKNVIDKIQKNALDDKTKRITAYHEAGHAIACLIFDEKNLKFQRYL